MSETPAHRDTSRRPDLEAIRQRAAHFDGDTVMYGPADRDALLAEVDRLRAENAKHTAEVMHQGSLDDEDWRACGAPFTEGAMLIEGDPFVNCLACLRRQLQSAARQRDQHYTAWCSARVRAADQKESRDLYEWFAWESGADVVQLRRELTAVRAERDQLRDKLAALGDEEEPESDQDGDQEPGDDEEQLRRLRKRIRTEGGDELSNRVTELGNRVQTIIDTIEHSIRPARQALSTRVDDLAARLVVAEKRITELEGQAADGGTDDC